MGRPAKREAVGPELGDLSEATADEGPGVEKSHGVLELIPLISSER